MVLFCLMLTRTSSLFKTHHLSCYFLKSITKTKRNIFFSCKPSSVWYCVKCVTKGQKLFHRYKSTASRKKGQNYIRANVPVEMKIYKELYVSDKITPGYGIQCHTKMSKIKKKRCLKEDNACERTCMLMS